MHAMRILFCLQLPDPTSFAAGSSPKAAIIPFSWIPRINCLRYLGVPVHRSVMFGDNESVVTSSTIPHSQLNKRWTALSCHRVREAIAANVFDFWHIPGPENPADVLSKHWATTRYRMSSALCSSGAAIPRIVFPSAERGACFECFTIGNSVPPHSVERGATIVSLDGS